MEKGLVQPISLIRKRSSYASTTMFCTLVMCSFCKNRSTVSLFCFFFQAEDGIRDLTVTGVQTCALPISILLAIYDSVARAHGPRDRRFRVEHAQHLRPEDIPLFGKLGVIPSMQPYHAIDDGRWLEQRIGPERIKTTYAFRTLLDTGAKLAFGSDWTVAPLDPILGVYAAGTRRTLDGKNPGGWVPQQKITVAEALRAYTVGSAYATFDEAKRGVLARGYDADVVVIDRNLFTLPPDSLDRARVRYTIVGGKVAFRR